MLKAIYNAVIIQPMELEDTMSGSIIIPDMGNEKNKTGKVVDVGPGTYSATGVLLPTVLQPGDVVILPTMGFTKFEYKGTEYWVGPENQVLGVIKNEE
jgi:chaperonin GroES